MILELNPNEFTNENYSPYGNVSGQIANNHLERVIGYSYDTVYYTHFGYGGVMFINQFGKRVWNEVKSSLIDKLVQMS